MLLGDVVVGRFLMVGVRERLVGPLRILLALPYLGFVTESSVLVGCVVSFVGWVGWVGFAAGPHYRSA